MTEDYGHLLTKTVLLTVSQINIKLSSSMDYSLHHSTTLLLSAHDDCDGSLQQNYKWLTQLLKGL